MAARAWTVTRWNPLTGHHDVYTYVTYELNDRPAFACLPFVATAPEALRWLELQRGRS